MSELNPQDNPPEGLSLEKWAEMSDAPVLGNASDSAPMQMAFDDGAAFPESYRGDAFVALDGGRKRQPRQ